MMDGNRWNLNGVSVSTQSRVLNWPPSFEPDLKLGSGFCCDLKASISSLIKNTSQRWNLGKVEVDDLGNVLLSTSDYIELQKLCTTDRLLPLAPDTVRRMLGSEKVFTNKADVDTVADLYEKFFTDISSAATRLW